MLDRCAECDRPIDRFAESNWWQQGGLTHCQVCPSPLNAFADSILDSLAQRFQCDRASQISSAIVGDYLVGLYDSGKLTGREMLATYYRHASRIN